MRTSLVMAQLGTFGLNNVLSTCSFFCSSIFFTCVLGRGSLSLSNALVVSAGFRFSRKWRRKLWYETQPLCMKSNLSARFSNCSWVILMSRDWRIPVTHSRSREDVARRGTARCHDCSFLLTQEACGADVSPLLRIFFPTFPLDLLPAVLHRPAQPLFHVARGASCSWPPHWGRTPRGALGGRLGEKQGSLREGVCTTTQEENSNSNSGPSPHWVAFTFDRIPTIHEIIPLAAKKTLFVWKQRWII